MDLAEEWSAVLRAESPAYAQAALTSIRREFPSAICHTMARPGDFPHRPRARTPVFYGSFDWRSSVAAHWLLVRLLRVAGDAVPCPQIRAALSAQFSRVALDTEADYLSRHGGRQERGSGWGWALALAHEVMSWDDPDAAKWASALAPLAEAATGSLLDWLRAAERPVRHGDPANSAFGMSLALGHARWLADAGKADLLAELTSKTDSWFAGDTFYPGGWEPSGEEVLSPALAEAELMTAMLPRQDFAEWLSMFLPGVAGGEPASLFTPVAAAMDAAAAADDPGGAGDAAREPFAEDRVRWHALNAHRARAWRQVAAALPGGDRRSGPAHAAARAHAAAVLPHVLSSGHEAGCWLLSSAVLMLS